MLELHGSRKWGVSDQRVPLACTGTRSFAYELLVTCIARLVFRQRRSVRCSAVGVVISGGDAGVSRSEKEDG